MGILNKYIQIAEKENNISDEGTILDLDEFKKNLSSKIELELNNLKKNLNNKFGLDIDEFKADIKELKDGGIDKEEIIETMNDMPIKNKKIGLKIINEVFIQ